MTMTAGELKAARERLGMTQEELAQFLRLADSRAVRRWEQEEREVSGPASVAIAFALKHGVDVPALPAGVKGAKKTEPKVGRPT